MIRQRADEDEEDDDGRAEGLEALFMPSSSCKASRQCELEH